MTLTWDEYEQLDQFIKNTTNESLRVNALKAWGTYCTNCETEDYVVIRVHGYYCISKISNDFYPIEISDRVQPFDEDKVYPTQMIKKEITWD